MTRLSASTSCSSTSSPPPCQPRTAERRRGTRAQPASATRQTGFTGLEPGWGSYLDLCTPICIVNWGNAVQGKVAFWLYELPGQENDLSPRQPARGLLATSTYSPTVSPQVRPHSRATRRRNLGLGRCLQAVARLRLRPRPWALGPSAVGLKVCAPVDCWRPSGRSAEAAPLIEGTIAAPTAGGQGIAVAHAQWMAAIDYNGLSRYREALAAARQASEDTSTLSISISMRAMPELIEAAAPAGMRTRRPKFWSHQQIHPGRAVPTGDWASTRAPALLSAGGTAENLHREAIDPAGPHPVAARAGPRAPALRRVAAPREPPRRRPRAAADRAPHAGRHGCHGRHRRRGVRRTRPARAAGRPRGRAPADRRPGHACSPRRRRTSPGPPPAAAPTRRSPPSCSCPSAPPNGTCARYSPSSASARAVSSRGAVGRPAGPSA